MLIPTALPTSHTDGITDGPRMSDTCPVCTITDGISDGLPTDRKVWRDFRTFLVRISINFRRNYRRKLIAVSGIKFRRKLIEMRTKKVRKSRQNFRSVGNSVGNRADGHVSDMRAPSVMPSIFYVGTSFGNSADGHVSDMRATIRR